MNANGITTTTTAGTERFDVYYSDVLRRELVQYDYRHTNGELFSCVAKSIDACRAKRDKWIVNQ